MLVVRIRPTFRLTFIVINDLAEHNIFLHFLYIIIISIQKNKTVDHIGLVRLKSIRVPGVRLRGMKEIHSVSLQLETFTRSHAFRTMSSVSEWMVYLPLIRRS